MVQLPELCDEKSEAYKAGYKNICEIGEERIRRAANKLRLNGRKNIHLMDCLVQMKSLQQILDLRCLN